MKKSISLEEMSQTTGGRNKFWDGFCAGVALVDTGWAVGIIALTAIGGAVIIGSTLGCAIREIALQSE